MLEVILGATIALAGTVLIQFFQNIHQQKQQEDVILFELISLLNDGIILSQKNQKTSSSLDMVDRSQYQLDLLSLNFKIMNLALQLKSRNYRDLGILFLELAQYTKFLDNDFVLDLTEKYQLIANKKLIKKFSQKVNELENDSKPETV